MIHLSSPSYFGSIALAFENGNGKIIVMLNMQKQKSTATFQSLYLVLLIYYSKSVCSHLKKWLKDGIISPGEKWHTQSKLHLTAEEEALNFPAWHLQQD